MLVLVDPHGVCDGKLIAPLSASSLKHVAAVRRGHSLTEAVRFHFMPDIRLICSFHRFGPCTLNKVR